MGGDGGKKMNRLAAILASGDSTRRQRVMLAALLVFVVAMPFLLQSNRWLTLFTMVLMYVVLASGLNIVVGFTGLLDLGYVAFYAIGGYFTAVIMVQLVRNAWGIELDSVWWLVWAVSYTHLTLPTILR